MNASIQTYLNAFDGVCKTKTSPIGLVQMLPFVLLWAQSAHWLPIRRVMGRGETVDRGGKQSSLSPIDFRRD